MKPADEGRVRKKKAASHQLRAAASTRPCLDVNRPPPLPKRPDRVSRPPSWGRTRPVTPGPCHRRFRSEARDCNLGFRFQSSSTLTTAPPSPRRSSSRSRLPGPTSACPEAVVSQIADADRESRIMLSFPCSWTGHTGPGDGRDQPDTLLHDFNFGGFCDNRDSGLFGSTYHG